MFLSDQELKQMIAQGGVQNLPDMTSDEDGPGSPVQPCSLDLTIGAIFVPGATQGTPGSPQQPKAIHSLLPGGTVVVETKEQFRLPNDIGAFGFPPTRVAKVGVLVTNLGHIDPGFDGSAKFTLVNMGHEPYSLRKDDQIFTALFFRLSQAPLRSFRERHPSRSNVGVDQEFLDKLPTDFLEVQKRAADAAKSAVTDELRKPYRNAVAAMITALAVFGGSAFTTCSRVGEVSERLTLYRGVVDGELDAIRNQFSQETEIQTLRDELDALRALVEQLPGGSPPTPRTGP